MSTPSKDLSYFEGNIIPAQNAKLSIQTHALQYGTSVFGGIRGYYNSDKKNLYVFRIKDHFKRLINSTKIMQLQFTKSPAELEEITIELLKQCGYHQNVYVRPIIYTSSLQLSPRFHDVPTEIGIYVLKLNDYLDTENGLTTCISSWRRIDDTTIPTMSKTSGGYVNSALAKSEAIQNGFDEAIFLDSKGLVSEGSAENIFIVRNGKIITPSLESSILEGITRRTIFELAKELGIDYEERSIARSELYIADEIFFSGTGVQVAWVKSVDKRIIADGKIGPISKKLQDLYFNVVKGNNQKFMHWLTPIY
ncbi:branched-chain amino acid transaminase [Leptospira sp. GIMC2001]|uniref:branched-chain amino acid transaminase n=1 Tax=Leptospira sp. GIMC2001 TaxID=1513297 RepID=UPI00234B47F0|nr:branched-chain amino acid transaminase [Leptospira sp. GIMC2001]WCL49520.1 branched-chain amino acid transaminase [Leptospira sp. GIMC2001]